MLSVIIPTYNRRDILRQTLESLTVQEFPATKFEVIVADDGSSDGSAEVAASFDGPLRLTYVWQEDRGHRASAVRNFGAQQAAAPIFAFLDCGTLAGPGFVSGHLAAHSAPGRRAVLGYCYGYDALRKDKWEPDSLGTVSLPELVRRNAGEPLFQDIRHSEFERVGFDIMKFTVPWTYFATMNCSMRATDFWAVGGFEEMFRSWGMEDTELGYRLYHSGVTLTLSRDAWTIELPVDRAVNRRLGSLLRNARMFHDKFPEPFVELLLDGLHHLELDMMETDSTMLAHWTEQVRELDVAAEIESALRELPVGASVAVFGCGGSVPASLPPAALLDFDAALLAKATADGRHVGYHAVGLRTPLAAKSADAVIVTSRLHGLFPRYGDRITAEAQRVGRRVLGAGHTSSP
ncbi:glycosyltransferase [Streptosporangiaceae bacterium NEAU-GS5]|nr:glycosyltransferase [Streptosporangiaceae bacterium NEAU-GS5]